MGQNHLRVLSLLNSASVEFIYDVDAEISDRLARENGLQPVFDLDTAMSTVDGIIICTPTSTHADYIERAANAGVRHLFVEKPLTDTLQSTLRMDELARQKALHIQIGFIERFNPAVQQMKILLDRSERVVSVDFVRTNKISARITDVDVVTDLMIHDIDLAVFLNGPVRSISAHGAMSEGMIGFASALLSHDNGRFSRVEASRITDKKIRSIQATCTDMFIDCELLRKEIILSRQSELRQKEGEPYVITAVEESIEVPPREALVGELQAFVAACRGEQGEGVPGLADAVEAMRICHEIQRFVAE
jgi:predicted dehydrogenase